MNTRYEGTTGSFVVQRCRLDGVRVVQCKIGGVVPWLQTMLEGGGMKLMVSLSLVFVACNVMLGCGGWLPVYNVFRWGLRIRPHV